MNHKLRQPKRVPLRVEAANAIRNAIIHGELRPGAKIPEAELAKELGVSRTPVREAVRILEQQGLVESQTANGTYIASLDWDEAQDSLHVRAALEKLAAEQAMNRLGREKWDDLCAGFQGVLESMSDAANDGDPVRITELDIELHTSLIDAADNKCLSRTWHSAGLAFLVWTEEREIFPYPQDRLDLVVERHKQLLEGFGQYDLEVCHQAIDDHIFVKFDDLRDWQRADSVEEE